MKKSFLFLLLFVICLFVLILFFTKTNDKFSSAETTLIKTFSNSGANILSSEIYFSGRMPDSKESFDEQKLFTENLAQEIGVVKNDSYSCRDVRTDSIQKIEVSGMTNKNRAIDINLEMNEGIKGDEEILTISVTEYMTYSGLEEIKNEILEVLKKYDIHPKINSCITGNMNGSLSSESQNELCNRILQGAKAEKISTTTDRNLISVSAYSHNIEDSIRVSGRKMNLNLALRYNANEDKTYVWLATPVITTEY